MHITLLATVVPLIAAGSYCLSGSRGDTLILLFVASAYTMWCYGLLRDGVRSERRWRIGMDAALVVVLPHCMWLGNKSLYASLRTFNFGFVMFVIGVWSAILGAFVLFAILYSRKQWVVWAVIGCSCIAIPFAPIATLALLLRWRRWRIRHVASCDRTSVARVVTVAVARPSFVRRQFTISGLLLMTAAIGAVIGYIRYLVIGNPDFIAAGIGIAVTVFLASLVSFNKQLSLAILPASLLLMGISSLVYSIYSVGVSDWPIVILCPATALFLFAHMRLHGFVPARETLSHPAAA